MVSKWVTKILFVTRKYEEAYKSVKKIPKKAIEVSEELIGILRALKVERGEFEEGGVVGQVIMNAING